MSSHTNDDFQHTVDWGMYSKILSRDYTILMPDGSKWAVPVVTIASDRAKRCIDEFDGDFLLSLYEGTMPLFASDSYEIWLWASQNMRWSDVKMFARLVSMGEPVDFEAGWSSGDWDVV